MDSSMKENNSENGGSGDYYNSIVEMLKSKFVPTDELNLLARKNEELKGELADVKKDLESKENVLCAKTKENENFQRSISERDIQILEQSNTISRLQQEVQEAEEKILELTNQNDKTAKENSGLENWVVKLEEMISEKNETITNLKGSVEDTKNELETGREKFRDILSSLDSAFDVITAITDELKVSVSLRKLTDPNWLRNRMEDATNFETVLPLLPRQARDGYRSWMESEKRMPEELMKASRAVNAHLRRLVFNREESEKDAASVTRSPNMTNFQEAETEIVQSISDHSNIPPITLMEVEVETSSGIDNNDVAGTIECIEENFENSTDVPTQDYSVWPQSTRLLENAVPSTIDEDSLLISSDYVNYDKSNSICTDEISGQNTPGTGLHSQSISNSNTDDNEVVQSVMEQSSNSVLENDKETGIELQTTNTWNKSSTACLHCGKQFSRACMLRSHFKQCSGSIFPSSDDEFPSLDTTNAIIDHQLHSDLPEDGRNSSDAIESHDATPDPQPDFSMDTYTNVPQQSASPNSPGPSGFGQIPNKVRKSSRNRSKSKKLRLSVSELRQCSQRTTLRRESVASGNLERSPPENNMEPVVTIKSEFPSEEVPIHGKSYSRIHKHGHVCKCKMEFKTKGALRGHLNYQNAKSQFKCSICPTTHKYKFTKDLRKHMKNKHNIDYKRVGCRLCGKTFKTQWDVTVHRLKKHKAKARKIIVIDLDESTSVCGSDSEHPSSQNPSTSQSQSNSQPSLAGSFKAVASSHNARKSNKSKSKLSSLSTSRNRDTSNKSGTLGLTPKRELRIRLSRLQGVQSTPSSIPTKQNK